MTSPLLPRIHPGRWTARIDGDFVVFLIGMRINKPWKPRTWGPVFLAMGPMLRAQQSDPAIGMLNSRMLLASPLAPVIVQIWRSFEELERFAREDALHTEPWKSFYRKVGAMSGDVGIWHETYRVKAGEHESIYANMPRVGLAAAGEHQGLGSASGARDRLGD